MPSTFQHNCTLSLILISFSILFCCNTNATNSKSETQLNPKEVLTPEYCEGFKETEDVTMDNIFIETANELQKQLGNNRILILRNKQYELKSTLEIENIQNLKIVGDSDSELMISMLNSTVVKITKAQNISIENLLLGHTGQQVYLGEHGMLRIENSSDIKIVNSKILGKGTFGLITKDVCGLQFENSEITKCTALIFDLDESRNLEFKNSKFRDNILSISVLGAFTNSTKRVHFTNCEFSNNQPKMQGNPAFNFDNNFKNIEDQIIFKNCTFKNNKGYAWYGEKIKLVNCTIDSTDFKGLQIGLD